MVLPIAYISAKGGTKLARVRKKEKNGPGLLFILVTLVVVAVIGARFFGFYPEEQKGTESPEAPGVEQPKTPLGTHGQRKPSVLVFHSHATENYKPNASHRRGGEIGDIVEVGKVFVDTLEKSGVMVIHDLTVHDKPRYSDAFINSAKMVEAALGENDQIQMVLDIHRDGLQDKPEGFTTVTVNGQEVAKILFVIGDKDNLNMKDNMAFAQSLSDALEAKYPGVTRGVRVFKSNYSGQLHPNSVMVVIGDWEGNSIEQAKASAHLLADVVATLIR